MSDDHKGVVTAYHKAVNSRCVLEERLVFADDDEVPDIEMDLADAKDAAVRHLETLQILGISF